MITYCLTGFIALCVFSFSPVWFFRNADILFLDFCVIKETVLAVEIQLVGKFLVVFEVNFAAEIVCKTDIIKCSTDKINFLGLICFVAVFNAQFFYLCFIGRRCCFVFSCFGFVGFVNFYECKILRSVLEFDFLDC